MLGKTKMAGAEIQLISRFLPNPAQVGFGFSDGAATTQCNEGFPAATFTPE